MTPQELREELLQREAYALGYKNGSADVIMSMAQKMEAKNKVKDENNGNSTTPASTNHTAQAN